MANFKDYLDYYKQTGKLPTGIDQDTMNAAVSNAEVLGIPSETTQIPFAPENQLPSLSNNITAGEDAQISLPQDSMTQKAKAMVANKPAPKAPVASAESQSLNMGDKPAPVNPLVDAEMQAAQDQARENRAREMYAMAGRQIAEGLGGLGSGQQVSLNKDLETMLAKTANAPVEELTTAREALAKKMSLASAADKRKVDSGISRAAQLLAIKTAKMAGLSPEEYSQFKNMSAEDLKDQQDSLDKLALSAERSRDRALAMELAQANKASAKDQKLSETVAKIRDKFLSSERYKGSMEQKDALKSAQVNLNLAKQGHSQAYAALGANLAKIAGEKGMLSEADVNRYLREKGVPGQIQNGIFQTTGKPTKQQLSNLGAMLDEMSTSLNEKLNTMADNEIAGYSYGYGVDPSKIEGVLPELTQFKQQKSGMVHMVDTKGREYDVPADKVEQAKQNGWTVK